MVLGRTDVAGNRRALERGVSDYPAGPIDPARPFERDHMLPLRQAKWVHVEVIDAHGREARST